MNTATQTIEKNVVARSDSARMKEALRQMAASVGSEVVQTVEAFIDDLEETIAAKDDSIFELEAAQKEMVSRDAVEELKQDNSDFVRGLATVHRLLKSGELLRGTSELEYYLDRNCDKWRMYVS